uniref:DUF6093 family protein n=1 Tax=Microbacterium proteolyticum TaxID=1572644 RepID=UPI0024177AB0|nr:DUF6093 family protein [Microbacterium proteolyticum]
MSGVLSFGRAAAVSRMTESITAGRFTDGVDEVTGDPTRVLVGDPLYVGPARVKYTANAVQNAVGASQLVTTQQVVVSIPTQPATVTPGEGELPSVGVWPYVNVTLPEGTVITVTASSSDPALVGRSYTVDGVATLGQSTAHRYPVTELS